MNKRMFEVILLISIGTGVLFFLLYHFYFDTYCGKVNGIIGSNQIETTMYMGKCRDKSVCSLENIKYDDSRRNVTGWSCEKKYIDYFEVKYYQNKIYNIFK